MNVRLPVRSKQAALLWAQWQAEHKGVAGLLLMSRPEVAIHLITASNARYLERIDGDVFDDPVQPALLQAFLANPANLLAVALCEGEVIGMASGISYVHPDKPLQLFIHEVGVSGRFRRHGIGMRLVRALLDRGRELGCTEAWVATEVGNVAARRLYTSAGGTEDADQAVVYVFKLGTGQSP